MFVRRTIYFDRNERKARHHWRGGGLRLEPCRNNQRRRIRFAEDYEFERWAANVGVVAAPVKSRA
jgi:hypothetical protein